MFNKISITTFSLLLISLISTSQLTITEVDTLPVRVSNNAVCEGFIDDTSYLFSFAGIDSTKEHNGIHLKCFRYNISTGESIQIDDLPDESGKLACSASRIGDIIYISGGYHVQANGNEVTSIKMHRYKISTNEFLSDAANLPTGTDDHVQVVWKDSLIFLITGWNNFGNINKVQIYNPISDTWQEGTSTPNNSIYKSFGASGSIIGDTIYYFGGAASTSGFNIQNDLRKGLINPDNPTEIDWSFTTPDINIVGYRMAACNVYNTLHWLGGSDVTYNYDGIAYNGTGGVSPNNRDLYIAPENDAEWNSNTFENIPMDLRGIANINDTIKYIAGGMLSNQLVSNKIFKLVWQNAPTQIKPIDKSEISIYPNPFNHSISINIKGNNKGVIQIFDVSGKLILSTILHGKNNMINTEQLKSGMYLLSYSNNGNQIRKKIIKL